MRARLRAAARGWWAVLLWYGSIIGTIAIPIWWARGAATVVMVVLVSRAAALRLDGVETDLRQDAGEALYQLDERQSRTERLATALERRTARAEATLKANRGILRSASEMPLPEPLDPCNDSGAQG